MTLIFHSQNTKQRFSVVIVYEEGFDKALCGLAICHRNDQFTKKLGVNIATGRAVRNPFRTIEVDLNLTEPEVKKFLLSKGYELIEEVEFNIEKFISAKY